jgi:hypothetical protein
MYGVRGCGRPSKLLVASLRFCLLSGGAILWTGLVVTPFGPVVSDSSSQCFSLSLSLSLSLSVSLSFSFLPFFLNFVLQYGPRRTPACRLLHRNRFTWCAISFHDLFVVVVMNL